MAHPEEEPLEDLDEQDDGDDGDADTPQQARVRHGCCDDPGGAPGRGVHTVGRLVRRARSTHGATVADAAAGISHARRMPWGTLIEMLNMRLLLRSRDEA